MQAHRSQGFSLIEMMVTVAVISVALTLGLPAWNGFVGTATGSALSNELESDIALARMEALRRQAPITLCAGAMSGSTPTCSLVSNWSAGRIIYCTDSNKVGACCPDGPGTCASTLSVQVLKVRQPLNGGAVQMKGPATALVFHSGGSVSGGTAPIAVTICKPGGSSTSYSQTIERTLTIGLAGQLLATTSHPTACP